MVKTVSNSKAPAPMRHPARLQRPQPLAETVYEAIFQRLISLDLRPDDKVSIDALVRELGVSQTPVREALARLEAQGLVIKTHLVGYRAAPQPTKDQFEQLFDTRMLLEPATAANAAARIDDDSLQVLSGLLDETEKLSARNAPERSAHFARLDTEFHHVIAVASGNAVTADIMDFLQVRVQVTLLRHEGRPVDPTAPLREHRKILSALAEHDGEAAAQAMREHLNATRERYWPSVR